MPLVDAGFNLRLTRKAALGVSHVGQVANTAHDNSVKGNSSLEVLIGSQNITGSLLAQTIRQELSALRAIGWKKLLGVSADRWAGSQGNQADGPASGTINEI